MEMGIGRRTTRTALRSTSLSPSDGESLFASHLTTSSPSVRPDVRSLVKGNAMLSPSRLTTSLAIAVSVAVAAPSTAIAHVGRGGQSVVGAGHVLLTDFRVSVQAGPKGQHPSGSLVLNGFLTFSATPTCVRIVGHDAVVGYRIADGPQAGQGFLTSVQDNGLPVQGQPVDTVVYTGLLPRPPRKCPSPGAAPPSALSNTGGGPLSSGDLTVTSQGHPPHRS